MKSIAGRKQRRRSQKGISDRARAETRKKEPGLSLRQRSPSSIGGIGHPKDGSASYAIYEHGTVELHQL